MSRLLPLAAALLLGACAGNKIARSSLTAASLHTWVGEHITEVRKHWGPPSDEYRDKSGNQIYVWTETKTAVTGGAVRPVKNLWTGEVLYYKSETTKVKNEKLSRQFMVNEQDVIVAYFWTGKNQAGRFYHPSYSDAEVTSIARGIDAGTIEFKKF